MTPARRSTRLLLLLALVGALVLTSCSGGDEPTEAPDKVGPTGAAAPPPAPRVGACYLLDVRSALAATSSRPAISCRRRHTAVTVAVGTVQPVVDGHLLALDSNKVRRQVADRCRRSVDAHVGGTSTRQRLSRIQAVWFTPTADQAERGALWFRCDLVVSASSRSFADLPPRTKRLLDPAGAMSRWGTCGTTAPSSKKFQRVLCSARHTWRARSTVALRAGTTYLSSKAGKVADARCRDVAAALSPRSTKLRWAFEWPTRDQWHAGQRYGLCWTPD